MFQHFQLYWIAKQYINQLNKVNIVKIIRKSYGPDPPSLARETFKRNLRSIVAIAKSHGVKVLLGNQPLQPSEEYFESHWRYKPYNNIVKYPLHNEFIQHHAKYNSDIKLVAEETHSLFIENHSVLNGNKNYFIDSVHYTFEGVQALATNYANIIIENNLIREHARY